MNNSRRTNIQIFTDQTQSSIEIVPLFLMTVASIVRHACYNEASNSYSKWMVNNFAHKSR